VLFGIVNTLVRITDRLLLCCNVHIKALELDLSDMYLFMGLSGGKMMCVVCVIAYQIK